MIEYYTVDLGNGFYDIMQKPQIINMKFSRLAKLLETSAGSTS